MLQFESNGYKRITDRKGGFMLKKAVTLSITIIILTVCAAAAGVISASAAQAVALKSVTTTSTSATIRISKSDNNNYTVLYSQNKDFSNAKSVTSNKKSMTAENLTPNTMYYFKLASTEKALSKSVSSTNTASAKTDPVAVPEVDYKSSNAVQCAVRIEFTPSEEASGYKMWIAEDKNFSNSSSTQGGSSLRFDNLKPNTTYYLKASTYVTVNGNRYYSEPVNFTTKTASIEETTVKHGSCGVASRALRIEFEKQSFISGYKMYISESNSFANARSTQGGSSLRFDNLKPNTTYYLKSYAYITVKGTQYLSEPTYFTYTTKALDKTSVNYSASNAVQAAVRIKLNDVPGASGYKLYIADNSAMKNAKSTQGGSTLRFDGLKPNTTYYLKAYSYAKVDNKQYYSEPITFTYKTKAVPKPSVNFARSNSVADAFRIEFNKLSGTSGTRMWMATNPQVKNGKMTEGGYSLRYDYLQPNTTYYVDAYSYITVNGVKYFSEPVRFSYKTKEKPAAPSGASVQNGMYQISWNTWGPQYTVKWNAVKGASKYAVYESSWRDGGFNRVATVTGTSYTVTEPGIGDHYYYIKAISGNGAEGYASSTCGIRYVGMFSTTGYCANQGAQTADGSYCASNHTIAAGYAYAFGTYFKIGDHTCTYEVEDRGGAVTNTVIDIYFDSYWEACNWGRRWMPVYQTL